MKITLVMRLVHFALYMLAPSFLTEGVNVLLQQEVNPAPEHFEDDFSPGMLFLVIIAAVIIFVAIGIGIVLAALAIIAFLALISIGIVSTSFLVGFYNSSFSKGFKTFVLLSSAAGGALALGLVCWGINELLRWLSASSAIAIGAISGLVAGFLFGYFAIFALRKLAGYLRGKYENRFIKK